MNRLFNLAVDPTDLAMSLLRAGTQAEMQAVIGSGGGGGGAVDSVNGQTGAVVLSAEDVGAVGTGALGVTVATLVGGKVPNSQVPPLAITSTFVVSTQAAQLALVAEEGDVCIRTDLNKTYIKLGTTLGTMLDWQEMLSPTAPVQSVNGRTGVVSLVASDVGAATAAQGAKADTAVQPPALATKANLPGGWTNAAYQNGFETYPNFVPVGYRVTDGRVDLRGTARTATGQQHGVFPTVFTLPENMRPSAGDPWCQR
ncbi:hypothetical protein [Stenotrophomonas phage BUCT609]|uniref:Uncharacterized protein n=1 Tax=Stenotrophomonas phage BUCT609 TaxID=2834250 RepID=A0A8E6PLZ4_9CAUD|nr:hypothetical protein [Stenotrophomonas phage BUCT609]